MIGSIHFECVHKKHIHWNEESSQKPSMILFWNLVLPIIPLVVSEWISMKLGYRHSAKENTWKAIQRMNFHSNWIFLNEIVLNRKTKKMKWFCYLKIDQTLSENHFNKPFMQFDLFSINYADFQFCKVDLEIRFTWVKRKLITSFH